MDLGVNSFRGSRREDIAIRDPDSDETLVLVSADERSAALHPGAGAVACSCGEYHPIPRRRRFLHYVGLAGAGVAGWIGGMVGYKPSAAAEELAVVQCNTPPRLITCGANYRDCIGNCAMI